MSAADPEVALAQSWEANAEAWTQAVRGGRIASRRLATDAAILDAIRGLAPRRVLDAGCGEGWLARALVREGIDVVGIDASAALVAQARATGGARFERLALEEVSPMLLGRFDLVACNFALLGGDLAPALTAMAGVLSPEGRLLVQTVHPWSACGGLPYRDGWREEDFVGFGGGFERTMPWYFRTLQGWMRVLADGGWQLQDLREPLHPETGQPASLLLLASRAETA